MYSNVRLGYLGVKRTFFCQVFLRCFFFSKLKAYGYKYCEISGFSFVELSFQNDAINMTVHRFRSSSCFSNRFSNIVVCWHIHGKRPENTGQTYPVVTLEAGQKIIVIKIAHDFGDAFAGHVVFWRVPIWYGKRMCLVSPRRNETMYYRNR